MKKSILILVLIFIFLGVSIHAEGLLDKIKINGFLSQGYMKSATNNFLTKSKDGSFEINELGLAISAKLSDKLRVGFQLFSRDLGTIGNNKVVLDWAFADYHFSDMLGLRIGRIKLPFGLYNEGRDTDVLRPMVFLPQGVYDEGRRGFMVAIQGAGVYGNLSLGGGGDIDYSGYAGTANIASNELVVKYFLSSLNQLSPLTGVTVPEISARVKHVYGGQLIWNTPLEGLRVAGSFLTTDLEFNMVDYATPVALFEIPSWFVLSMEYTVGNLTASAEYLEMTSEFIPFTMALGEGTSQAYYGMLSYMISDMFTLSALYDVSYSSKDDKEGQENVSVGLPDYLGWRKDFGACLRCDINANWQLKMEWHSVDGAAQLLNLFNPEGFEQKWNYFVFKTSFNF
ncbi:MAG: hypothetical protein GY757_59735 [bacterium]|nr:hypothetical protein [bacterium]